MPMNDLHSYFRLNSFIRSFSLLCTLYVYHLLISGFSIPQIHVTCFLIGMSIHTSFTAEAGTVNQLHLGRSTEYLLGLDTLAGVLLFCTSQVGPSSSEVEFRKGPDVTTVRGCNAWIEFTCDLLLLVATQQIRSSSYVLVYGKDVEGLKNSRSAVPGTFWYP